MRFLSLNVNGWMKSLFKFNVAIKNTKHKVGDVVLIVQCMCFKDTFRCITI